MLGVKNKLNLKTLINKWASALIRKGPMAMRVHWVGKLVDQLIYCLGLPLYLEMWCQLFKCPV